MSSPTPPTPSRARAAGAAGGKVAMWQAFGFLCAYLWKKFDPAMTPEIQVVVAQFFGAAGLALHQYIAAGGESGGDPPLRSSMTNGLALVALVALVGGCVSYDPATAAGIARQYIDATEITPAECDAFRASSEALDPEDGRDGPETTWRGPLGLEEELERAAEAQRLLGLTCDRALDPETEDVPFEDLARAYSDAWCAVLELTSEEGCTDAR